MNNFNRILGCTFLILALCQPRSVYASSGSVIVKSIATYLLGKTGKEATEQAVTKLTKEVGEEVIERTATRIVREGGEKSLLQVGRMVADHGPEIVRALDNVPDALPILRMLDELPVGEIGAAAARLSAGSAGKELASLSGRLGSRVLRAEAMHPGVGCAFARALGKDGAELSLKLSRDQAIQLGRHVDDIAQLPSTQQSALIALVSNNVDQFARFVGRFVERNPGKVLFTAAGTTLILAEPERFLGGDEIVFDVDGNPVIATKPGIIGRVGKVAEDITSEPLKRTLSLLGVVIVGTASLYLGLWMWPRLRSTFGRDRGG